MRVIVDFEGEPPQLKILKLALALVIAFQIGIINDENIISDIDFQIYNNAIFDYITYLLPAALKGFSGQKAGSRYIDLVPRVVPK